EKRIEKSPNQLGEAHSVEEFQVVHEARLGQVAAPDEKGGLVLADQQPDLGMETVRRRSTDGHIFAADQPQGTCFDEHPLEADTVTQDQTTPQLIPVDFWKDQPLEERETNRVGRAED